MLHIRGQGIHLGQETQLGKFEHVRGGLRGGALGTKGLETIQCRDFDADMVSAWQVQSLGTIFVRKT